MRLVLFFACFVLAWQTSHVQSQAAGLNTRDVIALLNKQMRMNETLFTGHRAKIRRLSHHLGRTWHEGFSQLSLTKLPNITDGCAVQIGQFTQALRNEEEWAYRVIDSFGKIPSGIVLGNFAWIGELSECINITAIEETWRGQYVLLERPMDPLEIFRPGSSLNFKYGMCMPNNCTQEDIYEIISLVLSPIPEELNLLKPNESYIQIRTPKVLTTGAISTLSVLGAFLLIVIIATVFDLYKRFQFEVKYSQLISLNTSSEEVAATNETAANETSQTHHHNPHHHRSEEDFEKRFLVEQENEPIFSQILLNFSAYTNARKVFEASKNKSSASNLKCLNGIRVLSLAWVILGHTYIFALTFSDNMMIVSSWVRQINLMIISNAFFSVDSFFLLSGFLTCYVFMREVDKTPLRISHLIKYYFHRIWRLTPLYAIVFLVSLYLSPYLGDSPLYPTTGVEPEFCKQRWWINFLYINNLVDPQKMCFGLSWYLANDTQFHFFAPIILIPFALKKKVLGYILSALILAGNTIAIALTMYYNEGMEVAQYGNTMYTEFFNKFYVLPWCRIAPYIVGLLTAHIFIQHKKSARKNIKLLDYFLWLIALTTMTLMVFGPYRDAKGEEPLSRTARIFYQSFSRTAWSVALGYVIYSCALFNNGGGGFVNKILSCWIWSPLSKINYAAFLIHVLVLTWFNANQEHPLHLQHSLLVYAFVSNWIFSYVLAFFFHVFIEAPLIGLEKFLFFHR